MVYKIDHEKIGKYVSELISMYYPSTRKFCIAYLKLQANTTDEPSEDEINNMANRLSRIKKGDKAIQVYDLPIFSNLLSVTYEQILSAGKCDVFQQKRLTNFTVAQSPNKNDWENYLKDENQPILYSDEYGKTVIDYAIEFANYELIKFLVDENYIWFDSGNYADYITTFEAGTDIQKIKFEEKDNGTFIRKPEMDDLQYKLATDDQLRMHIISLAADNNDISMLEKLRAREIPDLYSQAHYSSRNLPDFNSNYDSSIIKHIAKAQKEILTYFTNPFTIKDTLRYKDGNDRSHTFVFPYISQLLDFMIENKSPYLKKALEKMIQHNITTEEKLNSLIKQSVDSGHYSAENWTEEVLFKDNSNIISFRDRYTTNGIITNIAKVTKESDDPKINILINQLNESYARIKQIK